ncbi:hypothetical protein [Fodinicola feengrottensis]|uniref:Uncharacterized protein n=1 Tax=Fodinicola feengrottensis TaxID=435914 RepID=A0ABP4UZC1_9ACTN|nr:hypothetical protein [Fodinicola feengrottensis]
MVAKRYEVELKSAGSGSRLGVLETNIDPQDGAAVRSLLEEMVLEAKGTLNLDLSRFIMRVHTSSWGRFVDVRVSSSGETTIDGKVAPGSRTSGMRRW